MKGKSQRQLPCLNLKKAAMLTEPPEIQADPPRPLNIPARQDTLAMVTVRAMSLPAVTNDLATIATLTTTVEDATLVGSKFITKATVETLLAGAGTHTRITIVHHLTLRTKTAKGHILGLPTRGSAAELPYPLAPPATNKMTAMVEPASTTTVMATKTSVRGTGVGLHEIGRKEATENVAASVAITT